MVIWRKNKGEPVTEKPGHGASRSRSIQTLFCAESLTALGTIEAFRGLLSAKTIVTADQIAVLARRARLQSIAAGLGFSGMEISEAMVAQCLGRRKHATFSRKLWRQYRLRPGYDIIAGQTGLAELKAPMICHLHRELFSFSQDDSRHCGAYRGRPLVHQRLPQRRRTDRVRAAKRDPPGRRRACVLVECQDGRTMPKSHPPSGSLCGTIPGDCALCPRQPPAGAPARGVSAAAERTRLSRLCVARAHDVEGRRVLYKCAHACAGSAPADKGRLGSSLSGTGLDSEHGLRAFTRRAKKIRQLPADLSPVDTMILSAFVQQETLCNRDLVELTALNRNTLKLHLRHLVERGLLTLQGAGRGARYQPCRRP